MKREWVAKHCAASGLFVLLWSCLQPAASFGQAAGSDNPDASKIWYQIEVLVVKPTDSEALKSEQWPLLPELSHSATWRIQPNADISDALETAYEVTSELTSQGLITVDWQRPSPPDWPGLDETLYDYSLADSLRRDVTTDPVRLDYLTTTGLLDRERRFIIPRDNPNRPDGATSQIQNVDEATPLPVTTVWLSDQKTPKPELLRARQRLANNSDYQVLAYLRWAEILAYEEASTPVRLDTASWGEHWPELQGDITVYVSRFLHVKTNLWLNTSGQYLPDWRMPPPPPPVDPVAHLTSENKLHVVTESKSPITEVTPLGRPDWQLEQGIGERFRALERARPDSVFGNGLRDNDPEYPFRHAIALSQTRKMRSGEIHYIDHPALGIVVSITRIEDEALVDFKRSVLEQQPRPD